MFHELGHIINVRFKMKFMVTSTRANLPQVLKFISENRGSWYLYVLLDAIVNYSPSVSYYNALTQHVCISLYLILSPPLYSFSSLLPPSSTSQNALKVMNSSSLPPSDSSTSSAVAPTK